MIRWHLVHPKHGILQTVEARDITTARELLGWDQGQPTFVQSAASYAIAPERPYVAPKEISVGKSAYKSGKPENPEGYFTADELAEYVGCSPSAVREYAKHCGYPPIMGRKPGNNGRVAFYSPESAARIKAVWDARRRNTE